MVARKNPTNQEAPPKYYAVVNASGEVNQRDISMEISERSTVTPTDSVAVIEALLAMIPKMLADGRIVKLGEFGSFYTSVSSEGTDTPEEFRRTNINATRVRFRPGKVFMRALQAAEFRKVSGGTPQAAPAEEEGPGS